MQWTLKSDLGKSDLCILLKWLHFRIGDKITLLLLKWLVILWPFWLHGMNACFDRVVGGRVHVEPGDSIITKSKSWSRCADRRTSERRILRESNADDGVAKRITGRREGESKTMQTNHQPFNNVPWYAVYIYICWTLFVCSSLYSTIQHIYIPAPSTASLTTDYESTDIRHKCLLIDKIEISKKWYMTSSLDVKTATTADNNSFVVSGKTAKSSTSSYRNRQIERVVL